MSASLRQFAPIFHSYKQHLDYESYQILYLLFESGFSQKEVARQLSITIAKTKQKIAQAILELRRLSNDPEYIKAMQILERR